MTLPRTRVAELLGIRYPIIQAPMAGGPSTMYLSRRPDYRTQA